MRSSSAATSVGLERSGGASRLGRRQQVGGVLLDLAVLFAARVEQAQRGELARDGGRGRGALGQRGGVAAQRARRRPRARARRRCPPGELAEVDAVGAARLLGRAAPAQVGVEQAPWPRPGRGARLRRRGAVLHRHGHGSGRHRRSAADRGRGHSPRHRSGRAPWHRIQGTGDATTMWYAVMRKRTRGVFIGTLCIRHGDHHASLLRGGVGGGPDRRRSARHPARGARCRRGGDYAM